MDDSTTPRSSENDKDPYAGRWVARLGDRVVGQGGTPEQAQQAARAGRFKEIPEVSYVASDRPLTFNPLLEKLREILPASQEIHLVGGAVRDALLQRSSYDLDFSVPKNAQKIARKVANALNGAYYSLDDEHPAGRVVLVQEDRTRNILDFADLRGPDLESDLHGRDFTINAIAVNVKQPEEVLDPLGGVADLLNKRLRMCANTAFSADPIRILRAVRFAAIYRLRIEAQTRAAMRKSTSLLASVSPERMRDELYRILENRGPATSLRALDMLGALNYALPELEALKGIEQSTQHIYDVWEHSLQTIQYLEKVLNALDDTYDPETADELSMGEVVLHLGRYRKQITAHIQAALTPERSLRPSLFLAALYHDIAKPEKRAIDDAGRVRFHSHEARGAEIIERRGRDLRLSTAEISRLKTIIMQHMRPLQLAKNEEPPSSRAVYRFFRDTSEAGVDVALISLADLLATYGNTLPQDLLRRQLEVIRALFQAWWEQPEEQVSPPRLLNGDDLMREFDLQPGPQIGQLLETIREAQAAGEVGKKQEALALVRQLLEEAENEHPQL